MNLKDIIFPVLITISLTVSGCLEMELKVQPGHVQTGSSFTAVTEVVQTDSDDDNARTMLYAINKPTGWTINSVSFSSPQQGDGTFSYIGDGSDAGLTGPAGLDEGWETAVETAHPSSEGMHWQMYMSDVAVASDASEEEPDTFHVSVDYTVDAVEGNYGLTYWVSYDSNDNALADEDNTSADAVGGNVVAYDPASSSLVTFTLDDQTWLSEDIMFKGSMNGWDLFQGYDDGTNGDAVAGDHVWTGQYAVINDGNYEWGAIENDGSENGVWLMAPGENQLFTVTGTLVEGSVDYTVPAEMLETAGVVVFTVTDETELQNNIWWKGTPTDDGWTARQMYDDGTNGDEVAGDHVWTIQIENVAAGDHQWGAQVGEAGNWLIEGGNPSFTLDDDLLTIHGQTDYVIPYLGDPITKTVLFNVDMTEWLDEEGNTGMRAFNIANGDTMQVRGSFNNWGSCTECTMTRTPGSNIFSLAAEVSALPDAELEYAFYMGLTDASIAAVAQKFSSYDSEGNPSVVNWIGWETSPQFAGNRKFMLGEDDGTGLVELPAYSFYDAFPGSVIPEGHTINVIFSIDMSNVAAFDATQDSVYLRTHEKWLNLSQGFSDGQDLNHYAATAAGDGVYEFPVTLSGPVMWNIYYKWGWYDLSEATENDEAGGGLGGAPRIKYLHQDMDANCEWPSTYRFSLDTEFLLEDNEAQEEWDPDGICMELLAVGNNEVSTIPSAYSISDNYPNPFNPSTEMEFTLPMESDISFTVYSLTGKEMYSYNQSAVPGGTYKITWNGKSRDGRPLPSGVYLYEFRAGNEFRQVKKMTLLK